LQSNIYIGTGVCVWGEYTDTSLLNIKNAFSPYIAPLVEWGADWDFWVLGYVRFCVTFVDFCVILVEIGKILVEMCLFLCDLCWVFDP